VHKQHHHPHFHHELASSWCCGCCRSTRVLNSATTSGKSVRDVWIPATWVCVCAAMLVISYTFICTLMQTWLNGFNNIIYLELQVMMQSFILVPLHHLCRILFSFHINITSRHD
jgi:hypothetical protein